jgi:hypothetical protein
VLNLWVLKGEQTMWKARIREGSYCFWIVDAAMDKDKRLLLNLEIQDGDRNLLGRPLSVKFNIAAPGAESFRQMISATGHQVPKKIVTLNLDRFIGLRFAATLKNGCASDFMSVAEFQRRRSVMLMRMQRYAEAQCEPRFLM